MLTPYNGVSFNGWIMDIELKVRATITTTSLEEIEEVNRYLLEKCFINGKNHKVTFLKGESLVIVAFTGLVEVREYNFYLVGKEANDFVKHFADKL